MSSDKKVKELQQRRKEVQQGGGEKAIQKQVAIPSNGPQQRMDAFLNRFYLVT